MPGAGRGRAGLPQRRRRRPARLVHAERWRRPLDHEPLFLLALLRPASAPGRLLLAALLLSFAVEFSQLYQADWIDALRANRFGALVLGRGFLWADLPP